MHITIKVEQVHIHMVENEKLSAILTKLNRLENLMNTETQEILNRIDAVSTDLAGDLQALIDRADQAGQLTAAEINTALGPRVQFLEQLAHVADSPVPPPPPPIEPAPET